jgi:hypothetical protein
VPAAGHAPPRCRRSRRRRRVLRVRGRRAQPPPADCRCSLRCCFGRVTGAGAGHACTGSLVPTRRTAISERDDVEPCHFRCLVRGFQGRGRPRRWSRPHQVADTHEAAGLASARGDVEPRRLLPLPAVAHLADTSGVRPGQCRPAPLRSPAPGRPTASPSSGIRTSHLRRRPTAMHPTPRRRRPPRQPSMPCPPSSTPSMPCRRRRRRGVPHGYAPHHAATHLVPGAVEPRR